jgi:hypothetical protein
LLNEDVAVPPKYAVYADSSDDEALVNLFRPVHEFESDSSVDEAVLSVPDIVIGVEPSTVNPEHDTEPEHEAEVVAVVDTNPVEPM